MNKSISIFPENNIKDYQGKWQDYIKLASKYHFTEVFSTLHLPELTLENQIAALLVISKLAKQYKMELTVDIGGPYLKKLLENENLLMEVKKCQIDYVRLDYGYKQEDVIKLYQNLNLKGFMINASMYNKNQIKEKMDFFNSLSDIKIKACHNFYPREETALDKDFALRQDEMLKEYNIPIYYFIPSLENPRGPVFKGLPTIEKHRYSDIVLTTLELLYLYKTESFMFSDEFYSEESFKLFDDITNKKEIEIRVDVFKEEYEKIILKTHEFRYDSNSHFLRSRSSREMSQYASVVETDNTINRAKGSITIDNKLYGRYSGEMQVVLEDSLKDERVNVVGKVHQRDLEKLLYYNYGYRYKFVKNQKD